jgi:hypothetical protein
MCRLVGYGMFVTILEDELKLSKWIIIFNVQQNRVMCICLKIFFEANEITEFGGLNLFS